ncbi:MAG: P-loop NTPase [Polyangiaceae bacterium]|nr:P-loop NTPase [Polyangiaceae bacterium]
MPKSYEPQPATHAPPGGVPAGVRHVITVGGGRGGVGKSLLTVNLGVYLAQLGREVLIADADLSGSSLHIQLGLERPPLADRDAVEHLNVEPVATSVSGLRLLPTPFDATASSPFRPGGLRVAAPRGRGITCYTRSVFRVRRRHLRDGP